MIPLRATSLVKTAFFLQWNRRQVTLNRAVTALEKSGDSYMTSTAELVKNNTQKQDENEITPSSLWQVEAVKELGRLGAEMSQIRADEDELDLAEDSDDEYSDAAVAVAGFKASFGHVHGIHYELSEYKNPVQVTSEAEWQICEY